MYRDYQLLQMTILYCSMEDVKNMITSILFDNNFSSYFAPVDQKKVYFPTPEPGLPKRIKLMIWEPKEYPNKTIFFTNIGDGWFTLMNKITVNYMIELYQLQLSLEEEDAEPIYSFLYQKGEIKRLIRTMKDGKKWEFYQEGEVLDFEDISFYNKRIIKQRFNYSIARNYLFKIGIDIESDDFWISDKEAFYMEKDRPT